MADTTPTTPPVPPPSGSKIVQPIKLYGYHFEGDKIIHGITEDCATIRAAIQTHVGDTVHTLEHVFHLQKEAKPPKMVADEKAAAAKPIPVIKTVSK